MPLFKLDKKNKFLIISVLLSEILIFLINRDILCKFLPKCFKTTEKQNLAVWGSLWGEKRVFVNISPILLVWSITFDQTTPNFPQNLPFFKVVKKTNFLSVSVLFSEIVKKINKWELLCKFPQKCFKTTEKHS